jgi:hypothetical protein
MVFPEKIVSELDEQVQSTLRFNTVYFEILSEINDKLSPKIEFFLLKGGDLILRLYQNKGLRPLDDLDFLIHPENLKETEALLLELGFSETGDPEERRHHRILRRRAYSRFYKPLNSPFFIEIHWDLRWMFYHYNTLDLWKNSQEILFNKKPVKVFEYEDLFLYLGVHWMNHWRDKDRLIWACDLAWLINLGLVPWEKLWGKAARQNLAPTLEIILYRLSFLWNFQFLKIPKEFIHGNTTLFQRGFRKLLTNSPWISSFLSWNAFPPEWKELFRGVKRTMKRGESIKTPWWT